MLPSNRKPLCEAQRSRGRLDAFVGLPALPHTEELQDLIIAPTIALAAIASIKLPKNQLHASVEEMGM